MAFLNMPYVQLVPFHLGHVKKLNLHFQLQWFDYENGIGFTVWTKIRLRPSKAFWELGRKAVYCQGA